MKLTTYRGHEIRAFRYTDSTHLWNAETRQPGGEWDDTYAEQPTEKQAIQHAKETIDNELDA